MCAAQPRVTFALTTMLVQRPSVSSQWIRDALFLKVTKHSYSAGLNQKINSLLEPGENGNDDLYIRGCADSDEYHCSSELVNLDS